MKTAIRILLLVFVFILVINLVHADGWHMSDYQLHMEEPSQKAVISWDDGQNETMILSSAVKSDDISNFAWVIPIQSYSKPEVTAGNISIFEDLVKYFEKEEPYWGRAIPSLGIEGGAGVEVLESKEVDIYDITILKATNSTDLINWLNDNGYKVPEEAKAILDKYIAKGDYYFIANKIDLKNKFKEKIAEVEAIYSEKEKQYNQLCEDINTELAKKGIKDKICQGKHQYWYSSEILGIISNYINSNENPLNLPVIWTQDLGSGLVAQERFGAEPTIDYTSKTFEFSNLNKYKTFISILKDGSVISTNYRPFSREDSPIFLGLKLEEATGLTKQEIQLIRNYYSRKNISISPQIQAQTSEILQSFAEQLNKALGTKIYDCDELNSNLYYYASRSYLPYFRGDVYGKEIPEEEPIPLHVKIWSAFDVLRMEGNYYFIDVFDAVNDLQWGLTTPLKFEFQPHKLYYPLEISSLNSGSSSIEVYVLALNPVADKNKILEVDESKIINMALKTELKKHMSLANSKYVTRLIYEGKLANLTSDAEFEGRGIVAPQPPKPQAPTPPIIESQPLTPPKPQQPVPPIYAKQPNFFQKIWDWAARLFGK